MRLLTGVKFQAEVRVMDTSSEQASRLLSALADTHERITDLARELRLHAEVTRVVHGLSPKTYKSGPVIEGYVDAELRSGRSISWWLEITWGEQWQVSARILENNAQAQETLRSFPDRSARTIDGFISQLGELVNELTSSINSVSLS
jgi:hypothetical protein